MIISASRRKHTTCFKITTMKSLYHLQTLSTLHIPKRRYSVPTSPASGRVQILRISWWESRATVSYNLPFLRDTSFTIIFPHFPFVLQPNNHFHKFWKKKSCIQNYTFFCFLLTDVNLSSPWVTGPTDANSCEGPLSLIHFTRSLTTAGSWLSWFMS